ncbi:DUF3793 family protein [Clostridium sp. C105KSO13]|uniref:DUF3793 family protein n=1 Tax=Clostridium sp. C105KSO13 TaxID=1776045 RepID=UPI0007406B56|nr:DUF3793 family protein [Clostridium sp. C105KSO13]CUX47348.1 hypothetical protein BN3456_02664 [Clostridium sp. C105KSO13]
MPAEVLSYFLKHKDIKMKLKFQIVLQCAPLLKGLKISCSITMDSVLYYELEHIFGGTGILYRKLTEDGGRCFVLFYREEELCEYLKRPEVRKFIRKFGYEDMDLKNMISRLSYRISLLLANHMGFPHEIGVFLGYPVEDVRGFIENQGQKYLLLGYWKVYSNPVAAKVLFIQYDQAKTSAVNEFLTGKSMREIVQNPLTNPLLHA